MEKLTCYSLHYEGSAMGKYMTNKIVFKHYLLTGSVFDVIRVFHELTNLGILYMVISSKTWFNNSMSIKMTKEYE